MIDLYNKPKIINNISEGIFKNEEEDVGFPIIPFHVETHSAKLSAPLVTIPKILKKLVIFSFICLLFFYRLGLLQMLHNLLHFLE